MKVGLNLPFLVFDFIAPSPLMGEGWDEGENQDRDPSLMLFK
jgi:hypothetical protein